MVLVISGVLFWGEPCKCAVGGPFSLRTRLFKSKFPLQSLLPPAVLRRTARWVGGGGLRTGGGAPECHLVAQQSSNSANRTAWSCQPWPRSSQEAWKCLYQNLSFTHQILHRAAGDHCE